MPASPSPTSPSKEVAILGGGIAGLASAYWLNKLRPGLAITVFEKDSRTGGKLHSFSKEGFLLENGPHVLMRGRPTTVELLRDIPGLEIQPASASANVNFLLRKNRLQKVPTTPLEFLQSGGLSAPGFLRLLAEPLMVSEDREKGSDASVRDFCYRRFGREFTNVFIDPIVNGIYGSSIGVASVQSVLPRYYYPVQQFESFGKYFMREFFKDPKGQLPGLVKAEDMLSFAGGLGDLSLKLRMFLESRGVQFKTDVPVQTVVPEEGGWSLATLEGLVKCDAVISCLPAPGLAQLLEQSFPQTAKYCKQITYAPLAVVYLGYTQEQTKHIPYGFGFLVSSREKRRVNGGVYLSRIFSGRVPASMELFSLQLGGLHYPDIVGMSEAELIDVAKNEAKLILGLTSPPQFTHVVKHIEALPVFRVGHAELTHKIQRSLPRGIPPFVLSGSAFHGTGLEKGIAGGKTAVETLLRMLV